MACLQEQLDLAARVEMLPALVLGQHAEREGATPSPAPSAVPALSLSSLQLGTPNSAAAQALGKCAAHGASASKSAQCLHPCGLLFC